MFLVPAIAIFILFMWVPIFKGFLYSFYTVDFVKGNTFVGFDNYSRALTDPDVLIAVRNSPLLHGALSRDRFLGSDCLCDCYFRAAENSVDSCVWQRICHMYMPAVVLYGLWRWLYDPVGPINAVMGSIGADQIAVSDGHPVVYDLACLHGDLAAVRVGDADLSGRGVSIPRDWYEAAEIDGAGVWARIRHITLPSLRNPIVLMLILQVIATSQGYQSQIALLDGGPNNATLTYALLIVKYAFTRLDYGTATALGMLMFVVLGGLGILQFKLNKEDN